MSSKKESSTISAKILSFKNLHKKTANELRKNSAIRDAIVDYLGGKMSNPDQAKAKMLSVIEHLKNELKAIRTGRANPAMLDGVVVEVYGTQMKIKDLASVTTPEPRQLLLTPFDVNSKGAIAKAIQANLGFTPIVDGNAVRINIPPMDEAMRKEMKKLCQKKAEEAKVGVRLARRDANDSIRKQKSDGLIAEDEQKKQEKIVQDLTDKFCKEADDIAQKKESEISTI
jgi:ribosome recycling factor